MGRFFTSLTLSGLLVLLISAGPSYWSNTSSNLFLYPKNTEKAHSSWESSMYGIFSVSVEDCENDVTDPTITAPTDVSVHTDANSCTASGVVLGTPSTNDNCEVASTSNDAPTNFPLGATTVTWTVKDKKGNIATATQTVTVVDNEDPTLTLASTISETTDTGKCTASIAIPNAVFSDNCSGSLLSWTLSGATTGSGTGQAGTQVFNIGTTTIAYTITDAANNVVTKELQVTVADNEDPTLTLANPISETTDIGECTASIAVPDASFDDNCSVRPLSWTLSGATTGSGTGQIGTQVFNIGTTTIAYTVTDAANNSVTKELQVTVADNEDPTLTLGNPISENTDTEKCTASIAIPNATFNDNCSGSSLSWTLSGATTGSGTGHIGTQVFNIGTTTIVYKVTDAANNAVIKELQVTVADNEDPTLTLGNAISETTDIGECTASIVVPDASFGDNCSGGLLSWTLSGATTGSGTGQIGTQVFNIGITIIAYTVIDAAHNAVTKELQVTVADNEDPTLTLGNAISATTDAAKCTASIAIPNSVFGDNCSGSLLSWTLSGATTGSGTGQVGTQVFNIGTTTIVYTVTDAANNAVIKELQVTVADNEDPALTLGNPISETTDIGKCTASIAVPDALFDDNCSGSSLSWTLSGATTGSGTGQVDTQVFNIGTTTIAYTVTDAANNAVTKELQVTVADNEKPVITAGADITVPNIADQCYAGPTVPQATANDNCSVGAPTGTRDDGQPLNATYPVGVTIITWKVTDANGNEALPVEQKVIVEDTEAPVPPVLEDVLSGCAYTFEVPMAVDNCTSDVTVTHDEPLEFGSTGTITWTFTDAAGNSSTAQQTVTIDPIVTIVADKIDVLCNGHATGQITVSATGGVGPYTFDWGSLGTGDTKTDLPAGIYYVTAKDKNGCETAPLEVTIEEPETFVEISSLKITNGCFQGNNGTATVEARGGVGTYTYLWDDGQTTQTATGLAPGSHSVTVIDSNGCSKQRTFTISAPAELKVSGFLTTETTSYGSATGTATAQVSGGTPNYTFKWSNGATGQTARDLAAGKYTVTVTDANGCTATREVTIIDALDAIIMPTSICEGEDDIVRTSYFEVEGLTAKGGTPGYTYSWNFGEGAVPATATGPGPHRVKYSVIGDKRITLKVTDSKGLTIEKQIIQYVGGCFSNDCGSNDLAADNYFIGDANGNKITSVNCAEAGQKYLYIAFPTKSERYSLNIEYIYSVTNLSTGEKENFKEAGCFYSQQPIPTIARTIPIDYSCGDLIIIEGIYLTFSNNSTWKCGQGPAPKCYSTNNETSVTLPLYAVAFPNQLLCNGGEDGVINARASGGTGTYSYKLISAVDGSTVRGSQPSSSFTGLPAGRYKVVVSDAVESYTTSEVEIKQPSNPLKLELVSQSEITCFEGSDGIATVRASGGTPNTSGEPYIYIWEGIGQTTPTATNLVAGTYTVRALDANGCEVFLDVVIGEPAEVPANAGPDQVLPCGNLSTYLSSVFNPEVPEGETAPVGTWSIVNGPAGGLIENIHDPASRFTGTTGTYTLRWTLPCGTTDDVKISFISCSTLDFDGVNDHVVVGDKFNLPPTFTIEAWVKQDPNKTAGIKTIFSERDNSSLSSGGFDLIVQDNVPKFRWNGSTIASKYPIGTDRWYHIAVILGGEAPGLYVDGIKVSDGNPGQPSATSNPFIIGASHNSSTPSAPENYFHGWIEEVRLWKTALTKEQLRFLMNQRLEVGSSPLKGTALPIAAPGPLNYNEHLISYYPLIVTEITNGVTADKGPNAYHGKMVNIETVQQNTAPLPYFSANNGAWTADNIWLRPAVWDHPNSKGIDGTTFIDWNIAVTKHNIGSQNKDITVLGLRSEAGKLTIANPSGPQNENNSGQKLRVTHYLKLNGVIDLFGESQLLQDQGSILDAASTGYLERDQQGRASSYNYNYWSSPVSVSTGNPPYSVAAVMKDGTTTTFKNINFGDGYRHADGGFTDPRRVSRYWIHKFFGTAGQYSDWQRIGSSGLLEVGEGYSMKGTSGYASLTELQNYTFVGMPNNGTISLTIGQNQNYLIGNPYPSAIDANEFIKDNLAVRRSGNIFNGSLYFWSHFSGQTHYLARYIGGYAVYNLSGGVKAIANDERIKATGDVGGEKPQQYIPVGQAFFVNTVLDEALATYSEEPLEVDGGEILFKNSQRVFVTEQDRTEEGKPNSVFHTAEKKDRKATFSDFTSSATSSASSSIDEQRQRFWLKFKSPTGYHRQLLVTRDPETTSGFDLGYDAPLNEDNMEDMYWMINGHEFVIQGVPDFDAKRILPIGIKTSEEGEFSISIDELENIPDGLPIYVRDSINNVYHNLRLSDFKGKATTGIDHERYSITFHIPEDPEAGEGDEGSENPGDGDPGDEDNGNEDGEPGDGEDGNENGDSGDGEEEPGDEHQNPPLPPVELELLYSGSEKAVLIRNPHFLEVERAILFNGLGQELLHFSLDSSAEKISLPVEVPNIGVYFIRVHHKEGSKSLKFLVE